MSLSVAFVDKKKKKRRKKNRPVYRVAAKLKMVCAPQINPILDQLFENIIEKCSNKGKVSQSLSEMESGLLFSPVSHSINFASLEKRNRSRLKQFSTSLQFFLEFYLQFRFNISFSGFYAFPGYFVWNLWLLTQILRKYWK